MTTLTQPPATALRIQRLTRNEAQALSALAQRARACSFRWDEQPWELTLTPLAEPMTLAGAGDAWRVQALWAGAPFCLLVPAQSAQSWITARFPDLETGSLPDELAAAALEAGMAQVVSALDALQRGPAQVQALQRSPAAADSRLPHGFAVAASCGTQVLRAWLATDSLGLMILAGLVARLPALRNELPAADLPLRLRAELGRASLSAAELASLQCGDAVMLQEVFLTPQAELWLGQGDFGVRVRCDDAQLTVTQAFTQLDITMPSNTTPEATDTSTPMDKLPLRVSFDLGERTMTLGELQALQVGQPLELGRPLSSAVSLRVNGALIGTGELVEIDGRLGVTITALASEGRA